jgi:hypothetical protein
MSENIIGISTERYEELVSAREQLKFLEKAYRELQSYRFDDILLLLFGPKEKEGEKC